MKHLKEGRVLDVENEIVLEHNSHLIYDTIVFHPEGSLVIQGDCIIDTKSITTSKKSIDNKDKIHIFIIGHNNQDTINQSKASNVEINIGTVCETVRISAYGANGEDGSASIPGINGGDGGNGYIGGNAGDGSDAVCGTSGKNGHDGPNVTITYESISFSKRIVVNNEKVKNKKSLSIETKGGLGGKGSLFALGGKGGVGGKGSTEALNGKNGKDGKSANAQIDGDNGVNGMAVVKRKPLEDILNNLNGLYIFDFSLEEDREYYIKKHGGYDKLKENEKTFNMFDEACKTSIRNAEEDKETPPLISCRLVDSKYKSNNNQNSAIWTQVLKFSFYDKKVKSDSGEEPNPWKIVYVSVGTKRTLTPYEPTIIDFYSDFHNVLERVHSFKSRPCAKEYFDYEFETTCEVMGKDCYNDTYSAIYRTIKPEAEGTITPIVTRFDVIHPKWNKTPYYISMYYNRSNSTAEYSGGDYNNLTIVGGAVRTLVQMQGDLIFNQNHKAIGLSYFSGKEGPRPIINYNSLLTPTGADVVYYNEYTYPQLYEHLKSCFNVTSGTIGDNVKFNFEIDLNDGRSKYDWHHDLRGVHDLTQKTIYLNCQFSLDHSLIAKDKTNSEGLNGKITINIVGISKEDLDTINEGAAPEDIIEYYKLSFGSATIYIPPIKIFWGCFGKDTLIKMHDGSLKKASDIKLNDRLFSPSNKKLVVNNIVSGQDDEIYLLKFDNQIETKLSGGHPLITKENKVVRVCKINVFDEILTEDLKGARLISKEKIKYNDTVYNFEFEDEDKGAYIIADGLYSGDLKIQNNK